MIKIYGKVYGNSTITGDGDSNVVVDVKQVLEKTQNILL